MRGLVLAHGRRDRSVDSNRAGKHKALDLVPHGFVDQVDAAEDIIGVIETPNKMRQPLRRVGRQVIDVTKAVLIKESSQQRVIQDGPLKERYAGRDVAVEAS